MLLSKHVAWALALAYSSVLAVPRPAPDMTIAHDASDVPDRMDGHLPAPAGNSLSPRQSIAKEGSYCSDKQEMYSSSKYTWTEAYFCIWVYNDGFAEPYMRIKTKYYWGLAWYSPDSNNQFSWGFQISIDRDINTQIRAEGKSSKLDAIYHAGQNFTKGPLTAGSHDFRSSYVQDGPYWGEVLTTNDNRSPVFFQLNLKPA